MSIHWKHLTTQGRIDAIRSVWFPGCSTAQIASNFREATRNAIIGIYQRYGSTYLFDKPLNARSPVNKAGTENKRRRATRGPYAPVPSKPLPEPVDKPTEARLCGKPLMLLQAKECRWPVNEAAGDDIHLFCALPSERVYCKHHIGRAYRLPESRAAR